MKKKNPIFQLKYLDSFLLILYLLIMAFLFGYYVFFKDETDILVFLIMSFGAVCLSIFNFVKRYRSDH